MVLSLDYCFQLSPTMTVLFFKAVTPAFILVILYIQDIFLSLMIYNWDDFSPLMHYVSDNTVS